MAVLLGQAAGQVQVGQAIPPSHTHPCGHGLHGTAGLHQPPPAHPRVSRAEGAVALRPLAPGRPAPPRPAGSPAASQSPVPFLGEGMVPRKGEDPGQGVPCPRSLSVCPWRPQGTFQHHQRGKLKPVNSGPLPLVADCGCTWPGRPADQAGHLGDDRVLLGNHSCPVSCTPWRYGCDSPSGRGPALVPRDSGTCRALQGGWEDWVRCGWA